MKMVSITEPFVLKEHIEGNHDRTRSLRGVNYRTKNLFFDDFDKQFGKWFFEKKEKFPFLKEKLWYANTSRQGSLDEAIKELGGGDNTVQMAQFFSLLEEYGKDIMNSILLHTNFFPVRDIVNDVRIIQISRALGYKWDGYGWNVSSYSLNEVSKRCIFLNKEYRIFFT